MHINTFHSNQIAEMIESYQLDIGFVYEKVRNDKLIINKAFSEQMYLICNKDSQYYENISIEHLDGKNEIFIYWGTDYLVWHDRYWSPKTRPYVTVNTGSMMINYLMQSKTLWALAPISVIKSMRFTSDLVCYPITPSPDLTCYQIQHRYPKPSHIHGIELFNKYLNEFLDSCEWITNLANL
ncbi:LysR family transcriptional regulator [Acidaminobacter sp. JC074]|uniref:LysR substrate-binding domain-containing protein n=1 Tax=Acidaminobacter sp. JC074 TaxID=2530199 RepID=UPI002105B4EA|nr:LysR substrate-binding domain-containing protein [Acidaminobacter sp. JC074]MCH4887538.1 LysR family transcriptional regulator [Acidaminobacter sp. JC074]